MAYNQHTSLYVLGCRMTYLQPSGAALVGATSAYRTNNIVQVNLGLDYETTDAISSPRGDGTNCVALPQKQTVRAGVLSDLRFCIPDPIVKKFLIGGSLLMDSVDVTKEIGYAAPRVGVEQNPDGVAFEFWTRTVSGGVFGSDLPYIHWLAPRLTAGQLADALAHNATDPLVLPINAELHENAAWDDPFTDWTHTSTSVWQWVQTATLPTLTPGYVAVA